MVRGMTQAMTSQDERMASQDEGDDVVRKRMTSHASGKETDVTGCARITSREIA